MKRHHRPHVPALIQDDPTGPTLDIHVQVLDWDIVSVDTLPVVRLAQDQPQGDRLANLICEFSGIEARLLSLAARHIASLVLLDVEPPYRRFKSDDPRVLRTLIRDAVGTVFNCPFTIAE